MAELKKTTNRTYKARLFEMIYSQKKELLELYNAVNGTNYDDPGKLEINTLKNAIYMSMHNDVSFIIDSRLMLYEHQSTYSPNLPMRFLMYVADLYSDFTKNANLYGNKVIRIPTPRFLVFFNGIEEQPSLELMARMLNINRGHNQHLMSACKTLRDYAEYTARVREYAEKMSTEDAVEKAITECIREGILLEFLEKNRAEAKKVSIYEYDEEKHMRQEREDARADEREKGIRALIETCKELDASRNYVVSKVVEKFSLTQEKAEIYMEEYWKE